VNAPDWVEPPPALPAPVIDSHCHLDVDRDGQVLPLTDALARARAVNVTEVVQVGCDLPAAARAVRWAREHDGVHAAVALHPTEAAELAARGPDVLDAALERIGELAADPAVVAVGETGLDRYWTRDAAGLAAQERSLRAHVRLARDLDRTLVVHDRDAHDDLLRVLDSEDLPERVVLHCFSGDAAMARRCVRAGWYLSFAGPLTFRNAAELRAAAQAAVAEAGLAQVLVETDAPYLTPHPWRGRTNSCYLLPWTVRALADVVGADLTEVCEQTYRAARAAFALPQVTDG
jgi:TatD DNase family protein